MNDETFNGIMAGLNDALAYVKGDTTRARVVAGPDVKAIRTIARKSQAKFAEAYHIPVGTVRDWEQGRRSPDAPARALLAIIAKDPKLAEKMLADA